MSSVSPFFRFGLFVTGEGEEAFLAGLFKPLTLGGNANFKVLQRVRQLSPITSPRRIARMVGSNQILGKRDEQIAFDARRFLSTNATGFIILIDDLEHARRPIHQGVFDRYRTAFDAIMPAPMRHRASVMFLVPMLEAYFLADPDAVKSILGIDVSGVGENVEQLPHPKNMLRKRFAAYDVVKDGEKLVRSLDLAKVLSNPSTCCSLRTLVKWCCRAMRSPDSDRFRLADGCLCPVTKAQIDLLPEIQSPN